MHEIDFTNGDGLQNILRDIKRAVENKQIEFTPDGLMVLGEANFKVGGVFDTTVQRHEYVQRAMDEGDHEAEAWWRNWALENHLDQSRKGYFTLDASKDYNLIPDAGIDFILNVIFGGTSKIATWYLGLFTSNSTPAADWDGLWANANLKATELTNAQITGSARPSCAFGTAASKSISTSSPASVTIEAGITGVDLYGATLNESSVIANSTSGKILLAATLFGTPKSGLGAADVVNVSYSVTGSST